MTEKYASTHIKNISNKKNLLVTLADNNYIDQAKQVFSSVYFNAGWSGLVFGVISFSWLWCRSGTI